MDSKIASRFQQYADAATTWSPTSGGKRGWMCFEDSYTADLGEDRDGRRFSLMANRMRKGRFYPIDAVQYFSPKLDEGLDLAPGDRVLQRAPILPFLPHLGVWSMVEIFAAKQTAVGCTLGYVTTAMHHGRGIWQATLNRQSGHLTMSIKSTTSPNSWLFWLGLPLARYLQLRARTRAIEEFRKVA